MSPEYTYWKQVPKDIKQVVAEELQKLSWTRARAINEGVAWLQTKGSISLKNLNELTPGQRADARKRDSPWYVLLPLKNTSRDKPQQAPAPYISKVTRRWRPARIR